MRNKVEIISKKEYRASDMIAACEAVNLSMLNALPDILPAAEVSDGFAVGASREHARFARSQRMRRFGRSAAMIVLALLVSLSAVLTANASVREAFVRWWKEIWEDRIVYFFDGGSAGPETVCYTLGWVPEGFELVDEYHEDSYGNLYYSDGNRSIVYEYSPLSEIDMIDILGTNEGERVIVDDKTFSYYQDLSGGSNIIIWIDESTEMAHMINADLTRSELTEILLSICNSD